MQITMVRSGLDREGPDLVLTIAVVLVAVGRHTIAQHNFDNHHTQRTDHFQFQVESCLKFVDYSSQAVQFAGYMPAKIDHGTHHVVHPLLVGFSLPIVQLAIKTSSFNELHTTAFTFSMIALFARSIADREPTKPISRCKSWPAGWATLILQPVVVCISLIVSPPEARISPEGLL